jgi:hypothetical protein
MRTYTRYFNGQKQNTWDSIFDKVEMYPMIYGMADVKDRLTLRCNAFKSDCHWELQNKNNFKEDSYFESVEEDDDTITMKVIYDNKIYKSVRIFKSNGMIDYTYEEAVNPNIGNLDYIEDFYDLYMKSLETFSQFATLYNR